LDSTKASNFLSGKKSARFSQRLRRAAELDKDALSIYYAVVLTQRERLYWSANPS